MKIYDGANVLVEAYQKGCLPKEGDVYFGTFIGCERSIGEKVHISANCSFVGQGHLYIGRETTIAPGVVIYTSSPRLDERVIGNKYIEGFEIDIGDVKIGKRCFIGANSVIHQGVSICDYVIVGAMSFVNKDITEPGTYVGNPLRRIR